MRDLYAVLRVPPDAEHDAIRASFRVLARQFHPDAGGDARQMQAINEAWAILGRRDRRLAYDRARAVPQTTDNHAQRPAAQGPSDALDYGRYKGWTIDALADHDPDYLEWLARSPAGRMWRIRIEAALARRTARVIVPPAPTKAHRRFWGLAGE
jgi:curved DNA-binding protein CbpA